MWIACREMFVQRRAAQFLIKRRQSLINAVAIFVNISQCSTPGHIHHLRSEIRYPTRSGNPGRSGTPDQIRLPPVLVAL